MEKNTSSQDMVLKLPGRMYVAVELTPIAAAACLEGLSSQLTPQHREARRSSSWVDRTSIKLLLFAFSLQETQKHIPEILKPRHQRQEIPPYHSSFIGEASYVASCVSR